MNIGQIQNNLIEQELQIVSLVTQLCQAALLRLGAAGQAPVGTLTDGLMTTQESEQAAPVNSNFGSFLGALQGNNAPADSDSMHITQVYDEKYNPTGAMRSSDCGPTALAMCLKGVGLGDGGPQDRIDAARLNMFEGVDASRDGVDGSGNKVQSEHSTSTDVEDVRRGAERMGAKTSNVSTVEDVARALESGARVALAGTNSGNIYGHGIDYNGGHFIAVSAYDRQSDSFTINDPLSHQGPFQVTRDQLRQYMWDQDGAGVDGIAISI